MTGIEEGALIAYLAAGSAAVAAAGTIYMSQQQGKADDYNADVAEKNATVARSQANANEEAQRTRARAQIGAQLAATSQSGTGLTGSNLDLLDRSLYNEQLDSMNIRYEGELKASGLNDQAALDRSQGSAARTGGYISAAGKLLSASSSYLSAGGTVPSNVGMNGNGTLSSSPGGMGASTVGSWQ